jgi:CRP-like cAMP-binding protein
MYVHNAEAESADRIERRGIPADPTRTGVLARSLLGFPLKFATETEIYGEGEPVEYVYEVTRGAIRTVKVLSDGRRTIGGFYFAGDMFGLEGGNEHSLSAEAIVDLGRSRHQASTVGQLGQTRWPTRSRALGRNHV